MIFPKADQNKTLVQLVDDFSLDTEGIIEVFKCTSRTYGALLATFGRKVNFNGLVDASR
jgi:hypothetical protein